jgi:hypothetical protein
MGNCKNCKFFDIAFGWPESREDGSCSRLGNNGMIVADAHFNQFITFRKDPNPDFVHVGENFGCVHFDERAS